MSGWQPIETAPKDGTAVLAFSPAGFDARVPAEQFVIRWATALEDGEGSWIVYRQLGVSAFAVVIRNPTHWMPLPEPPDGAA